MKNVYHFHIPKTAGRYVQNSLIFSLNVACKRNDINTRGILNTAHSGWNLVDNDTYLFTFIRNPIERTISHVMFYHPYFRQDTVEDTKDIVMDYLYSENVEYLWNYQSKFITSTDLDMDSNFYKTFSYDLSLMDERLSRFNKIVKCNEIDDQKMVEIYNESCNHLGMTHEMSDNVPYNVPDSMYFNDISKEIYLSLTDSEREYLEYKNLHDTILYSKVFL